MQVLLVIERAGGRQDGLRQTRVVAAGSIHDAKCSAEVDGWRVLRATEVESVHSPRGEAG